MPRRVRALQLTPEQRIARSLVLIGTVLCAWSATDAPASFNLFGELVILALFQLGVQGRRIDVKERLRVA